MMDVDVLEFEALEEEVTGLNSEILVLRALVDSYEKDSVFLTCLRNAGVYNWEGYDFAIEEYNSIMGNEE